MNGLEKFKEEMRKKLIELGGNEQTVEIGDNQYTYVKECEVTGKEYRVTITKEQYSRWKLGELIQNVLTDLSDEQRQFLISGNTPAEWKAIFPKEEEQ